MIGSPDCQPDSPGTLRADESSGGAVSVGLRALLFGRLSGGATAVTAVQL